MLSRLSAAVLQICAGHLTLLLCGLMLLCSDLTLQASPLDEWQLRNPLPTPYQLDSVAYGNGLFVAIGMRGTVLTSADGILWRTEQPLTPSLTGVAFGKGLFAAVGSDADSGVIMTSTNGVNWVQRSSGHANDFADVVFEDDRFIAVTDLGIMVTSIDGVQWTSASTPNFDLVIDIAVGAGILVVLDYPNTIGTTTDGVNWTTAEVGDGPCWSIAYGNGKFVLVGGDEGIGMAFGEARTSSDGVNWELVASFPEGLTCVAFHQGKFISTAFDGSVWTSEDGASWARQYYEPAQRRTYLGIAHGNERFVAVGEQGAILTSPDAIQWMRQSSDVVDSLHDVAYGSGRFVALSSRPRTAFLVSTNGVSWLTYPAPSGFSPLSVISVSNTFLAACENWRTETTAFWNSSDGQTWTLITETPYSLIRRLQLANGLLFALGQASLFVSTNGSNWAPRPGLGRPRGVAFGNGRYAAVSVEDGVFTSLDAEHWTNTWFGPVGFYDISFGNGRFVAVGFTRTPDGSQPAVLTSPDGVRWTAEQARPPLEDSSFTRVHYANGAFVTLDGGSLYHDGTYRYGIWTSSTGAEWTQRRNFRSLAFSGLTFGNGTFLAVGWTGAILQSGSFAPAALRIELTFDRAALNISLGGEVGREYRLQTAENSGTWVDLLQIDLTQPTTNVLVPLNRESTLGLFRAVSP